MPPPIAARRGQGRLGVGEPLLRRGGIDDGDHLALGTVLPGVTTTLARVPSAGAVRVAAALAVTDSGYVDDLGDGGPADRVGGDAVVGRLARGGGKR